MVSTVHSGMLVAIYQLKEQINDEWVAGGDNGDLDSAWEGIWSSAAGEVRLLAPGAETKKKSRR